MKHKIGDVVLVPMRIGGLWPYGTPSRHYVSVNDETVATIRDDFLDTCAAAPRVPKVGDLVRVRREPPAFVVDVDDGYAIVKWRHINAAEPHMTGIYPLTDLTIVEDAK